SSSEKRDNIDQYIDRIIKGIRAQREKNGPVKLLLFFHGGLNSRAQALQRAARDISTIEHDPTVEKDNIYPIFVNWQTSLYASYRDHLLFVHNGQDLYDRGAALWPFELASDLVRVAGD